MICFIGNILSNVKYIRNLVVQTIRKYKKNICETSLPCFGLNELSVYEHNLEDKNDALKNSWTRKYKITGYVRTLLKKY